MLPGVDTRIVCCQRVDTRHTQRSLLCSGDEKKILAAIEAMERTLDKYFDSMQTEKAMRERQADRGAIKRACANMNRRTGQEAPIR